MQRRKRLLGIGVLGATMILSPVGFVTPARAGAKYLLSGGNSGSGGGTRYTAPGLGNIYGPDFPDTGLGEQAAQIRMRAATLSLLKVSVVTSSATSGTVTVTVRINGAATDLSCSVDSEGGNCATGGAKTVAVSTGDRLAVQVVSTLNEGFWTFTYTVQGD